MRDLVNYRAKAFTTLLPVLRHWAQLNRRMGTEWAAEDDTPWWYNERASLSILAGAVWRAGGWAFEEFSASKSFAGHGTTGKQRAGRCDIMFGLGDRTFVAEAKQAWPNLGGSIPAAVEKVRRVLQHAKDDALRDADWGFPRLGIVFAAPMLHIAKIAELEERVSRFVVGLSIERDVSIAYVFPAAAANLRPTASYSDYVFPGTVLLIGTARHARDA